MPSPAFRLRYPDGFPQGTSSQLMIRLHVHLVSDSTGETLESVAKACLAQFQDVEAIKHYWPMVRSVGHLDRVMREIAERPGLIVYTRSEEHTSELQSLMRISYAVFCLKKKKDDP